MPVSIAHNLDCLPAMREMPDKAFDLAIVDPPYGIGASGKQRYHAEAFTNYSRKEWDNEIPGEEYFQELFRVSKNQIIWGGNYFTEFLPATKNWIVWDKAQPLGISLSMHELAFNSCLGQAAIFRVTNGENGNRCTVPTLARQYLRIHPTQKPIRLYKLCLQTYAKEGDQILDTHLGSGSSRIAAYDLGFDFTGYELDKDYFDAQEERFKRHIAQPKLFVPEEKIATQEGLFQP